MAGWSMFPEFITNTDSCSMNNIRWNLMYEDKITRELMYTDRMLSTSLCGFSKLSGLDFGWMNGCSNMGDIFAKNMEKFMEKGFENMWNPQSNGTAGAGNNGSTVVSSADSAEVKEYKRLKGIVEQFKKQCTADSIGGTALTDKIDEALKTTKTDSEGKTVNLTDAEKLEKIKAFIKEINTDPTYKNAFRKSVLSQKKYQDRMLEAGYNFNKNAYELKNINTNSEDTTGITDDKEIELANSALTSIKDAKPKSVNAGDYTAAQTFIASSSDPLILRHLSYANSIAGNSTDYGKNSYIAFLVNKNEKNEYVTKKGNSSEINKNWLSCITNAADSLRVKAVEVQGKHPNTELSKAMDAFGTAYGNYIKTDSKGTATEVEQTKANEFIKAFNNLYAATRLALAAGINKDINNDYDYLDNTEKELVDENLVIEETKKDIEEEGIKLSQDVLASFAASQGGKGGQQVSTELDDKAVDEQIKELSSSSKKEIKSYATINGVEVYTATNSSNTDKKFYIKGDNGIVELTGVTDINKTTGECTISGKNEKVNIKDLTADNKTSVKPSEIMAYTQEAKHIDQLINSKKIKKTSITLNCQTVYESTGKKQKVEGNRTRTPQYFIMSDGKLCEIDCLNIDKGGNIKNKENRVVTLDEVSLTTVNDDDIYTQELETKETKEANDKANKEKKEKAKIKSEYNSGFSNGRDFHIELDGWNLFGHDDSKLLELGNCTDTLSDEQAAKIAGFIEAFNTYEGDKILEYIKEEHWIGKSKNDYEYCQIVVKQANKLVNYIKTKEPDFELSNIINNDRIELFNNAVNDSKVLDDTDNCKALDDVIRNIVQEYKKIYDKLIA